VADRVIVECKATSKYTDVFGAQLLTYLRLTGLRLGLVINFGEPAVSKGIHRVLNGS
jgi:GxxExxY protein